MFWLICLCFSGVMTVGGFLAYATEQKTEIIVLIGVFAVFDLIFWRKYRNLKTGKTAEKKRRKQKMVEDMKKTIYGKHQTGLPIAQGTPCKVIREEQFFRFEGSGIVYELSKDKITDISIKTDVEIRKQYVSSAGGALAGGMVFGPLGAIVGGRTKAKKDREVTNYLIFTYRSTDGASYISFELSVVERKKIDEWKREIEDYANQREAIQLQ